MADNTNDTTYGDVNINVTYPEPTADHDHDSGCGCGCGCNPCDCGCKTEKPAPAAPKITVIQKHYHAGGCCPPVAPIGFHNQIWGTHSTHCPGDDCGCVETTTNCPEK